MNAGSIYEDCPLLANTRTSRVLHLQSGDGDNEICGSLHLLNLDANPVPLYAALSYVWGDPEDTTSALINGKNVAVTKNLHEALHGLRSKTDTLVIWVDALCIDQHNLEEKSYQVAFMTEIYRQCSRAYVWLGQPAPGTLKGNPFAFLEHWVGGRHTCDLPGFGRDSTTGLWTWKDNEECKHMLDDMMHVVKAPWWGRAWTAQESMLPKEVIVVFGEWTITWDVMVQAVNMKNNHDHCCQEAQNAFAPSQLTPINEWAWNPGRISEYADVCHGLGQSTWFSTSLLAFSNRSSKDPRDKIYSLLSLATDPIYQGYRPNYQAPVSEVFTDIFGRMLREAEVNLDCFMGGGFGPSEHNLPSWVRDFSKARPLGVVAVEERRVWYTFLYHASSKPVFKPFWNDKLELHCRGTFADTIKLVGPDICATDLTLREIFGQWLEICGNTIGTCEPSVLRSTFSRIVCADVCKKVFDDGSEFRRARETDFPEGKSWEQLAAGYLDALDQRTYGWGVTFGASGRCLFTTASGKMGLCHSNSHAGDEVWLISGARVPFVVRPVALVEEGEASRFIFLGDCFLNGIMDGELAGKEEFQECPIVFI